MRRDRFRPQKKRSWFKRLVILVLVWAITGGILHYRCRQALLTSPPDPALLNSRIQTARWAFFLPLSGRLNEMANLGKILAGESPAHKKPGRLTAGEYSTFLTHLLENQDLDMFRKIVDYLSLRNLVPQRLAAIDRFDRGDYEGARSVLASDPAFAELYKSGHVPVVDGVMYRDMETGTLHAQLPGTAFLVNHLQPEHHLVHMETTLDPAIQRILYESMDQFSGGFCLAKGSHLLGLVGKNKDPLIDLSEAGSVVKVVTMAAALTVDGPGPFPYNCNGPIRVDNRIFYDWKAHGKLGDYPHSLACSCNLVFAETGLRLGPEVMTQWMNRFGLSDHASVSWPGFSFQPAALAELNGDWTLARGAIGLDAPRISPYWLVMTAASLAGDGRQVHPIPFQSSDVFGYTSQPLTPVAGEQLLTADVLDSIRTGMELAVNWEEGTGHRAETQGVPLYLKTGTAGKSPYNSILMGWFDIQGERYSFGLFLEKGGKAEFNGAHVLKEAIGRLRLVLQKPADRETP